MSTSVIKRTDRSRLKEPIGPTTRTEAQALSVARRNRPGLQAAAAASSVDGLKQLLAGTRTLRDLYKEHSRQASGANFYNVQMLFDKHCEEQSELVDRLAERVETLGGTSIPMAPDVAAATRIPRAPIGREDTVMQIAAPASGPRGDSPEGLGNGPEFRSDRRSGNQSNHRLLHYPH